MIFVQSAVIPYKGIMMFGLEDIIKEFKDANKEIGKQLNDVNKQLYEINTNLEKLIEIQKLGVVRK